MELRAFQPARLRHARMLRGMQQNELANDLGLTGAAISQFESGAVVPRSETLEQLAMVLGCLPAYFARPLEPGTAAEPFFRRRRASRKRDLGRAAAYAVILSEIASCLERAVELPELRVQLTSRVDDATPILEIERIATEVRDTRGIGEGPLPNMVRLLEAGGVITAAVGTFDRVDAFSLRMMARPVVVLCSDHGAAARRRFDAAHELGHLLMHETPLHANKVQEDQAQRFAAALLMPAGQIDPWLPRRSNDLAILEEGSRTWGVSMQALLFRARILGAISEDSYRRTQRRMSAAGWRTREPVELGPAEAPELLARAVLTLPEAGSSLEQVADEIGLPRRRVARMLQVPEHADDSTSGQVVQLRATG